MPKFDGSVLTGDAQEEDVLRKKKRKCFFGLLVLRTAALRGFIIKMSGGVVGERTGLVKELDERPR